MEKKIPLFSEISDKNIKPAISEVPVKKVTYWNLISIAKNLKHVTLFAIIGLTLCCMYLSHKYNKVLANKSEFFITNLGTFRAYRNAAKNSVEREKFEIENFAIAFLRKLCENHVKSREQNIGLALYDISADDVKANILEKFNEKRLAYFEAHNAIDSVEIKDIKVGTDSYPYEVVITYDYCLSFPAYSTQPPKEPSRMVLRIKADERCAENPYGLYIVELYWGAIRSVKEPNKEDSKEAEKKKQENDEENES